MHVFAMPSLSTIGVPSVLWPSIFLLVALGIDRLIGDPPSRLHPVCLMGNLANSVEAHLRHGTNSYRMFLAGCLACFLVVVPCTVFAWCVVDTASLLGLLLSEQVGTLLGEQVGTLLDGQVGRPVGGQVAEYLVAACIVAICLAPRSLAEHARRIILPLEKNDLPEARHALSMIVGRQVDQLDSHGIARACVESVGENLVDGVLATLFWAGIGLCLFGYPEAAALAVLHRSTNVLDAQWGKKNERYIRFGTCAARLDDCLNTLPARLSLLCIALATYTLPCTLSSIATAKPALPRRKASECLRIGWQYRNAHESPNSAWSEAAFAGALGLKLGGAAIYNGMRIEHPWLGNGTPDALPAHIAQAIRLMWRTTILWACIFGLFYVFSVLFF